MSYLSGLHSCLLVNILLVDLLSVFVFFAVPCFLVQLKIPNLRFQLSVEKPKPNQTVLANFKKNYLIIFLFISAWRVSLHFRDSLPDK